MPILFSDLHYFEFPQLSFLDKGINSRVRIASSVVKQVGDLAEQLNETHVWFLGDLQYNRSYVSTVVAHEQANDFRLLRKRGLSITVLAGNHDFAPGGERRHHLHPVSKYAKIITKPYWDAHHNVQWTPFTTQSKQFYQSCDAAQTHQADWLLTHNGFPSKNVISNWSYYIEDICDSSDLPDIPILSGHYHNTSKIGKHGRYLGAPLQLNWGDEGIPKFIWHLNLSTKKLKPYSINSPQFVTLEIGRAHV